MTCPEGRLPFENPYAFGLDLSFVLSAEGQKAWFQAVNEIVMAAPDNMGRGVFWWEPMFRGRGFFDDDTHQVKPIVEAFENYAFPMEIVSRKVCLDR